MTLMSPRVSWLNRTEVCTFGTPRTPESYRDWLYIASILTVYHGWDTVSAMPRPFNPNTYHGWRTVVLRRDGYRCVWCGATKKLEVDHIEPYIKNPARRLDPDNGRTLCRRCHGDRHRGGRA